MSTMESLLDEVKQAPTAMQEEVLDFVRFLKSRRFAPPPAHTNGSIDGEAEVIYDNPRTISNLADEQRAFLASLSLPLVHVGAVSRTERGSRLASLNDEARLALQRQVAIFFGYGR